MIKSKKLSILKGLTSLNKPYNFNLFTLSMIELFYKDLFKPQKNLKE